MQGRNENILSFSDKIIAFQKKLAVWKECIEAGNLEMFPSTLRSNWPKIAPLILNHLDTLTSMTGLEAHLWNLNHPKDSLL